MNVGLPSLFFYLRVRWAACLSPSSCESISRRSAIAQTESGGIKQYTRATENSPPTKPTTKTEFMQIPLKELGAKKIKKSRLAHLQMTQNPMCTRRKTGQGLTGQLLRDCSLVIFCTEVLQLWENESYEAQRRGARWLVQTEGLWQKLPVTPVWPWPQLKTRFWSRDFKCHMKLTTQHKMP